MEALILVAERDGPTLFGRIGVMKALNARRGVQSRSQRGIGESGS